eukprot:gene10630-2747_t
MTRQQYIAFTFGCGGVALLLGSYLGLFQPVVIVVLLSVAALGLFIFLKVKRHHVKKTMRAEPKQPADQTENSGGFLRTVASSISRTPSHVQIKQRSRTTADQNLAESTCAFHSSNRSQTVPSISSRLPLMTSTPQRVESIQSPKLHQLRQHRTPPGTGFVRLARPYMRPYQQAIFAHEEPSRTAHNTKTTTVSHFSQHDPDSSNNYQTSSVCNSKPLVFNRLKFKSKFSRDSAAKILESI